MGLTKVTRVIEAASGVPMVNGWPKLIVAEALEMVGLAPLNKYGGLYNSMVPLEASLAHPDIITFPFGRRIMTEWYILTEGRLAIADHVFATGSKSMHGELGVFAPPATKTVLSGSSTALHCLRRVESGEGAVKAH